MARLSWAKLHAEARLARLRRGIIIVMFVFS
jgi:hypothetical protein